MSTIVVVKKNGKITIAADTLTTFGSTKESAEYIANCGKLICYQESYLGISGSASLQISLEDFFGRTKKIFPLKNIPDIFKFSLAIHKSLKDNYFLQANDDEDFETFRGDILIANPHGIFGISAYRYVQEFKKFYAHGSGSEYALGAMFATYDDEQKSAEDIAQIGVSAGIEFDEGSGAPFELFSFKARK